MSLRRYAQLAGAISLLLVVSTARASSDDATINASEPPADATETQIHDELSDSMKNPDPAPPPEYPQPGAPELGTSAPVSPRVVARPSTPENSVPLAQERPIRIDEDGNYIYDTKTPDVVPPSQPGAQQPKAIGADGTYQYSTKNQKPKFSARPGVEKPANITESGEYIYGIPHTIPTRSASFHFGPFNPVNLKNPNTGEKFSDIYSSVSIPMFMGEYEKILSKKGGRTGLLFGSGIFSASGHGVFKIQIPRRADDIPPEKYTLVLFPNTVSLAYHFQYSDDQGFVPYILGGGGYYTFFELRDDGARPKIGGTAVAVGAGGLSFLMDKLDPRGIELLEEDYGISHVRFNLEARGVLGIERTYDMTGLVFSGGISVDF